MKASWWNRLSLSSRLTAVVVALLSVGLIMGTAAMVFFLQWRLVTQLDDQLKTTADTVGVSLDRILRGDPETRLLPSDHYLFLQDSYYGELVWVAQATVDSFGRPDLSNYDFALATRDDAHITTVPNADGGAPWRVITVGVRQITSHEQTGTITIGLPLMPVDATLEVFLHRVILVDLVVILLGGVIGMLLITRAMRPLRQIEETAGRIATGDLTQRVPQTQPETTEVGSLAHSLNSMLAQIEHSFAHREASERRMRRFVSDASHELRTPLATVRGYGELYRLGGIPEDELPRAIGRIESEATRMSGLVDDLLTLARVDEDQPLQLDDVDLVVIAADAATDLRVLQADRPVSLVGLSGPSVTPTHAWADADQLRQVVANLMGNVIQHTPAETPLELAVGYWQDWAVIEVRDHGPGVPPDDLDKVFGRFYRVDTSRSRQSGGTGLGLAIVAAVVAAHDGDVEALTTPGGGLTVRVRLPRPPKK